MAAVTLLGTATFNTNSGTKTVTATPAVGDLIVIVTAHSGNTSAALPTDDAGGTYTLINSAAKATSADTMRLFVRNRLITSASSTIFTHAPGTSSGGGLAVLNVTGMARVGAQAVRQSAVQANQSAGGTPTPVFGSAALTANAVIGAVFNATNPATMTPRSSPSYTERADVGYITPTTGLEVMSINSGETGTSIAWGGTSGSAFSSIAAELDTSSIPEGDGDDTWWGGTALCMAGVAVAGSIAIVGAAMQARAPHEQTDEIAKQVYEQDYFVPLTTAIVPPVTTLFQAQDEVAVPPTSLGGGMAPVQVLNLPARIIRWVQTDENPSVPPAIVDDDYWQLPAWPVNTTVAPMVFGDVDAAFPAASPVVDEDALQVMPMVQSAAAFVLTLWDAAEIASTPAGLPVEHEGWQPYAARVDGAAGILWATDDDIVPQPPAAQGGSVLRSVARILRWPQADELPGTTATLAASCALVEQPDQAAGSATAALSASSAIAEAPDDLAAAAAIPLQASASYVELPDDVQASSGSFLNVDAIITSAPHLSAAASAAALQAAATYTEIADGLVSTSTADLVASAAIPGGAHQLASSAAAALAAAMAMVEAADAVSTISGSGGTLDLAMVEAADLAPSAAQTALAASLLHQEAADAAVAAGQAMLAASASYQEVFDALSASASRPLQASAAIAETADVLATSVLRQLEISLTMTERAGDIVAQVVALVDAAMRPSAAAVGCRDAGPTRPPQLSSARRVPALARNRT